jgi:hypothetical protein
LTLHLRYLPHSINFPNGAIFQSKTLVDVAIGRARGLMRVSTAALKGEVG